MSDTLLQIVLLVPCLVVAIVFHEVAHGLVARNVGDGVAFCPPLIVNEAQIDEIFDKFALALQDTLDHVTREGLLAA